MSLCAAAGFRPNVVQEAHGMHAVLSLVAVETGIAIVPASMAGFREGEIVYRSMPDAGAAFTLCFCSRPSTDNPGLQAFLHAATQAVTGPG